MKAIVIGASAGGIKLLTKILSKLPKNYGFPILVAQHIPYDMPDSYLENMNSDSELTIKEAQHNEDISWGYVYFAPADYHLLVESEHKLALSVDPPVHYARPSIDVLFQSAAEVFKKDLVGIILTGANEDGAEGVRLIKMFGGKVIVQHPETAEVSVMPEAARQAIKMPINECLNVDEIIQFLIKINDRRDRNGIKQS